MNGDGVPQQSVPLVLVLQGCAFNTVITDAGEAQITFVHMSGALAFQINLPPIGVQELRRQLSGIKVVYDLPEDLKGGPQ